MLILKGIIIGIGKIIPGVSGSLIAITLGEYENMLYSVNNYFKDIINNSKYLIKICLGILISIILFSSIIAKSISNYYIYTMFIFAGFILGSNEEIKKDTKVSYIVSIISFISLLFVNKYVFSNNLVLSKSFIYYFFGGVLDSITMVIPGISGTSMLISYGCYNEVIYSISSINIRVLFPFILGMIVGVIVTIKFISYMFNKFKDVTYSSILGISMATIIIMISKGIESNRNIISILISTLLLIVGYVISKKMTAILAIE